MISKLLTSLFMGLVCFTCLNAQDLPDRPIKGEVKDRVVFNFFHDNWLMDQDSVKVRWFSRGVSFTYFYDAQIGKSPFSLAAGLGFASHNVFSNAKIQQVSNPDTNLTESYSQFDVFSELENVKRHKLSTNYIDLPVELRFRSKPDARGNSWRFSVGARAGFLLDAHDKTKIGDDKYKTFIFPNVNQWRFGGHFKFGYQRWGIFGYYALNNLFEKNQGVEVRPLSIGFTYVLLE
ncbi:MAG: PorT family protein [Flavobacteriales bacterium]|nr:PorT family protein [Flavobacteriales bacterium]